MFGHALHVRVRVVGWSAGWLVCETGCGVWVYARERAWWVDGVVHELGLFGGAWRTVQVRCFFFFFFFLHVVVLCWK